MRYIAFLRRRTACLLAVLLFCGGIGPLHAAVGSHVVDGAQQPDPKKKELTATVVRSPENETLTLNAYFPEESNNLRVALYNILGKLIDVHPTTSTTKGDLSFRFTTRGLPGGPYIVVLESNGQRIVNKVMVSR